MSEPLVYDIRLVIASTYEASVPFARHVLRVAMHDRPGQRVLAQQLSIEPEPAECAEAHDFFGNVTNWITIQSQHQKLLVNVAARVERAAPAPLAGEATPAWEDVREAAAVSYDLSPHSPTHFVFPSRIVKSAGEIGAYATQSFPARRPVLDGARELMRRLHVDFRYDSDATHVTTTPAEAFSLKRGVCQDFTHVMIAGLRELGLPARYVSGFLRTLPARGAPRLEGVDATHAWVQVWCGQEACWQGLDPTNALDEDDSHVVIGVGRDYADVAPLDGVILTYGAQKLEVAVNVAPVSAASAG